MPMPWPKPQSSHVQNYGSVFAGSLIQCQLPVLGTIFVEDLSMVLGHFGPT